MKGLDRLHGSLQENRLQDRTDQAVRQAERRATTAAGALAGGELLEDLSVLAASFTAFPHTLGKAWTGFVVVKAVADVRVWAESTNDDDTAIRLRSSGDATVSVVVF